MFKELRAQLRDEKSNEEQENQKIEDALKIAQELPESCRRELLSRIEATLSKQVAFK